MPSISIVQLSDLHFGRKLFGNRYGPWVLGGYNPHDDRVLEELRLCIERIQHSGRFGVDGPLHFVITGDLTAGGTRNDFALAYSLLRRRQQHTPGILTDEIGYKFDNQNTLLIPGNHDHWNSDFIPNPYNSSLAGTYFEPTPWQETLWSTDEKLCVELFGIDSNSGMAAQPFPQQLMGMGSVSPTQLHGLELMLNHSVQVEDPLPLDNASRKRLETIAQRYGLHVVLTGHMHCRENDRRWPAPSGTLHELCAASPTAGPAQIGATGFQLHQIRWAGTRAATWNCLPFKLQKPPTGGFRFTPLFAEQKEISV